MHTLSVRREEINIVAGKATMHRRTKMSPSLSGRGSVSHSMVGRYTQARQRGVKGQDSKTLVTAGTIKRPLLCPVEEVEKQRVHLTT